MEVLSVFYEEGTEFLNTIKEIRTSEYQPGRVCVRR
jgi:hypothetical protein